MSVLSVSITTQDGESVGSITLSSKDDVDKACSLTGIILHGASLCIRRSDVTYEPFLSTPKLGRAAEMAVTSKRHPISWAGIAARHAPTVPSPLSKSALPNTTMSSPSLQVSPLLSNPTQTIPPNSNSDAKAPNTTQRNLYVLNLPLGVDSYDLTNLFSQFGRVVHSVVLSMLDTQARRRGFIDMETPESAKLALESLNGYVWRGYPLEVSYALVQRGEVPPGTELPKTSVIELSGLLLAATIDEEDVHSLIDPHGDVASLNFPHEHLGRSTFSVRVTMRSPHDAQRVCAALDGVQVNGQLLRARSVE